MLAVVWDTPAVRLAFTVLPSAADVAAAVLPAFALLTGDGSGSSLFPYSNTGLKTCFTRNGLQSDDTTGHSGEQTTADSPEGM
ncbi:UNVERIFIED_CONTAM: hypothetical protein FKN15_037792 [Acipenser sinensis]